MKTSLRRQYYVYFFAMVVSVLAAGCKVMAPQPMPAVKALPEQYSRPDSLRVADTVKLEFRRFFPDEHLITFIDSAMQHNTDLQLALQRVITAEARLAGRKGALYPSLDAVVSGSADKYGDYTLNGVGNFDTNLSPNINKDQQIPVSPTTDLLIGLRSNWEIDVWGKLKHLRKASLVQVLATREARQFVVTNLVARLTQGYYQLLAFDTELEIVRRNVRLQQEALEIVKAQKEGGRATELAVQQFAAQLLNTRAIEYTLLQDRVRAENELNALAGNYPQTIARDTGISAAILTTDMAAGVPASLLSNRPDIRQYEWQLEAARENVYAARKAFLPSLVISPYIGMNAFTPGLLAKPGSGAYGILGGITTPLLRQGELRTQYTMANAANREAVYQYQQSLLDAYSEVITHMHAVQNFKQSWSLKQQEVQQLQEAVVTARDLYLSGFANYLEVITAQKTVLEAELQLARQQRDIIVAQVQLYRSLGGGWQ
ncbi:efflux transporter outer membrane subunit [Paraflavitalea soli]|uniref:Efflux transporter outer membrane subunit n=1 Tax=Paraflavitalea soli TaxID=2315862 RepID=A0A3B7MEP7_9BACT|nr:efflux transporter outer membrane subunit [Paraflavitalea soli]AXY72804.1 efflux transporter outer membrane subunit [Paraflavitalea soli]